MKASANPKILQFSDSDAFYRELAAHIERGEPVRVQTDFTNINQVPERLAKMIDLPSARHQIADVAGAMIPGTQVGVSVEPLLEILSAILRAIRVLWNRVREHVEARAEVDEEGRLVIVVVVDPKGTS